MIDCDGLKAVNDSGGHELGDVVLQRVAECLREHKRLADVAGRLGDEFVVLLPETGAGDALGVAERFRRGSLRPRSSTGGRSRPRWASPASLRTETPAALLRIADRTLYAAKQGGGNQTLTAASTSG